MKNWLYILLGLAGVKASIDIIEDEEKETFEKIEDIFALGVIALSLVRYINDNDEIPNSL